MKHQKFKKNTYVQVNVGKSHLTVVGVVKDSTITNKRILAEKIFNIPQQAIELKQSLLIIQENPEITPYIVNNFCELNAIFYDWTGITMINGKIFAAIDDIEIPAKELKELYFKLNQGAKSNQR